MKLVPLVDEIYSVYSIITLFSDQNGRKPFVPTKLEYNVGHAVSNESSTNESFPTVFSPYLLSNPSPSLKNRTE